MAIQSFADKATEKFFETGKPGKVGWSNLESIVKRKLDMVDYAAKLEDLRVPPGNQLEALSGKLAGFHSIRITSQWRVIFQWTDAGPAHVEITDYH